MRKRTKIQLKIFIGLLVYFIIGKLISKDCANTCAVLALFILTVNYINLKIRIININSKSVNSAKKELLFRSDTLTNNYCIIKYFPNQKIIVMDNPKSKNTAISRVFVIDKTTTENLNFCWEEISKMYDKYTFFDNLFPYIKPLSPKSNIILVNSKARDFTIENIEEFISRPINSGVKTKQTEIMGINAKINEIPKQEAKQAVNDEKRGHITDLKDISGGKKVHVNCDDAMTISVLPGINIVKAKKLVEYRNIHGPFKNKDDFINLSGAKEHFHSKIAWMISVGEYNFQNRGDNLTSNFGRIVDY